MGMVEKKKGYFCMGMVAGKKNAFLHGSQKKMCFLHRRGCKGKINQRCFCMGLAAGRRAGRERGSPRSGAPCPRLRPAVLPFPFIYCNLRAPRLLCSCCCRALSVAAACRSGAGDSVGAAATWISPSQKKKIKKIWSWSCPGLAAAPHM